MIRHFVEVAEKNKKVFMEMLFWKGHREASEIMDGYGSYQGYSCNLTFFTMFLKAKKIHYFLRHNHLVSKMLLHHSFYYHGFKKGK